MTNNYLDPIQCSVKFMGNDSLIAINGIKPIETVNQRFEEEHELFKQIDLKNKQVFLTKLNTGTFGYHYLEAISDEEMRNQSRCNCCINFINRFGGLATINEDNTVTSLLWSNKPEDPVMAAAYAKMEALVLSLPISEYLVLDNNSEFLKHDSENDYYLGTRNTNGFNHYWVAYTPCTFTERHRLLEDYQVNRDVFGRSIAGVNLQKITEFLEQLEIDGDCKDLDAVKALREYVNLRNEFNGVKDRRERSIWLARKAANVHPGVMQATNKLIGMVYSDNYLPSGFESAKTRLLRELAPDRYRRMEREASEALMKNAQRMLEEQGYHGSLERRAALFTDTFVKLWERGEEVCTQDEPKKSIDFISTVDIMKKSNSSNVINGEQVGDMYDLMQLLPKATKLEVVLGPVAGNLVTAVVTTAVNEDAKPILKWDKEDKRNPYTSIVPLTNNYGRTCLYNPNVLGFSQYERTEIEFIAPDQEKMMNATEEDIASGDSLSFVMKGNAEKILTNFRGHLSLGLWPAELRQEVQKYDRAIQTVSENNHLILPEDKEVPLVTYLGISKGCRLSSPLKFYVHIPDGDKVKLITFLFTGWSNGTRIEL